MKLRVRGCLQIVGGVLLLAAAVVVIYFLGRQAYLGIQDVAHRIELNNVANEQKTVFPGTATAMGIANVQMGVERGSSTPQLRPSPTTEPDEFAEPTDTPEATQAPTLAASDTPAPTATASATATLTASNTATATLTFTATATYTASYTPSLTPTATLQPVLPTNTRRAPVGTEPSTPAAALIRLGKVFNRVGEILAQSTLLPTNTRRAPASTPTEGATYTPSPTMTPTLPPTVAPTTAPSLTPTLAPTMTSSPTAVPTLLATSTLPKVIGRKDCVTKEQPTAVPSPAPRMQGQDIMNIALMGTDADLDPAEKVFHTDTIMIVSINRTSNTVSMLSIPRDLYVCVPGLGMNRINTAFEWGERVGWTPGGGFGLLQETILYNLGFPVHYYALISFNGFKQVVDSLKGVDIAVDCPIYGPKFTGQYNTQQTPVFDTNFRLDVGYYHLDGISALWYARNRVGTSDFDRNRRQQQVLRAIWRAARDEGLVQKAPELWGQSQSIIRTNLQLQDILGLMPMALNLTPADINYYTMIKGRETKPWTTPQNENVQLPDPAGFFQTIKDFYTPKTRNKLVVDTGTIEIYNGSGKPDWDKVAADTLAWRGFDKAAAKGAGDATDKTTIYDFTGSASPSLINTLARSLNIRPDRVVSQPSANRTADFKVVLGSDYNSCAAPGFGTAN